MPRERSWISFLSLRRKQFAGLAKILEENEALTDAVARIIARRDERERFLLKGLAVQIALYVALVAAPLDGGNFTFFGLPFSAAREVLIFLLAVLNFIAAFNGMTVMVLNDFLSAWQAQKFPKQFQVVADLAFPSLMKFDYWSVPPAPPLQRTRFTSCAAAFMILVPFALYLLAFMVGAVATIYLSYKIWTVPLLQPWLSHSIVILFVVSYLTNLTYAILGFVPLPHKT
jgi:hypothetical protein